MKRMNYRKAEIILTQNKNSTLTKTKINAIFEVDNVSVLKNFFGK